MSASQAPAPSPSRRALLGALGTALGGAVVLSGCGVRLEEDAPDLPLIPRREPVPGETFLIGFEAATQTLATVSPTLSADLGGTLAPMFLAQAQLMRDVLLHGGLPADKLQAPATSLSDDLAADQPPSGRLAAAAIGPVAPPGGLAVVDPSVRPSMVSLAAQRYAAATMLTGSEPDLKVGDGLWSGGQLPSGAANIYLALLNGGYLFEVVAAHSSGDRRAAALAVSANFRRRAEILIPLLPQVPGTPLGAQVPEPVTDDAAADRVAQHAVTAVITQIAAVLPALTAGGQSTAGTGINRGVSLLGPMVVTGLAWGLPLAAFPGLS